jgi:hypothetical protein
MENMNYIHKLTIAICFRILILLALYNSQNLCADVFYEGLAPNTSEQMTNANYWIKRTANPNKLIMTNNQINKLNQTVINSIPSVINIWKLPSTITGKYIFNKITSYKLPYQKIRYNNKNEIIRPDYYDRLKEKINLKRIRNLTKPIYGIITKRANVRTFPTNDVNMGKPNDHDFDLFQETSFEIMDTVAILHISSDQKWYFVIGWNYHGWVETTSIALAQSKLKLFNFVNPKHYIIITAKKINVTYIDQPWHCGQVETKKELRIGTKLPVIKPSKSLLSNSPSTLPKYYLAYIPTRDEFGFFKQQIIYIPKKEDVHYGYLKYSIKNILTQIFKLNHQHYGWGGMKNGQDCSGIMVDIFKCFGIFLPRNSSQQRITGTKLFETTGNEPDEQLNFNFTLLPPGSLIFKPGHVMMYIGSILNSHYIIHSRSKFTNLPYCPSTQRVMKVIVSDLSILKNKIRSIKWARGIFIQ